MSVTAQDSSQDGSQDGSASNPGPGRRPLLVLVPLALFAGLAGLFLIGLFSGDPSIIPSPLIGRPAPPTRLPPVVGLDRGGAQIPGLDSAQFKGAVTVVNVWASWCVPCRDEAPLLIQLSKDQRFRLVGINYKDTAENALRFAARFGNPFVAAGADDNGRAGIEWGVYGVPETFVVGRDGKIAYKLVGPITQDNLDSVLRPQIEKALSHPSS